MQHLILLHGAIGSASQLEPLKQQLQEKFIIHTLNFHGHGNSAMPSEPFSISLFADQLVTYINSKALNRVHVFGYSMGGYVALYAAKHNPDLFGKIVTLATKFNWTKEISAKEVKMLDPQKIIEKVPAFAKELEQRHKPNDWKQVLEKTKDIMLMLGENNALSLNDYAQIQNEVYVSIGDRDSMVTLDETVAVYKSLPNGKLAVFPDTNHPIEKVDLYYLTQFLVHCYK